MAKQPRSSANAQEAKQGNVTHEKLADLPFKTAKELKEAQDGVRLQVWRRMEEAKAIHQILKKTEYSFWLDEFRRGLECSYEETSSNCLVRVHSDEKGIHISINKGLADSAPAGEAILGTLVKAMSESFAATYYRARGIMHPKEDLESGKKSI